MTKKWNAKATPVRVLHSFNSLGAGGIESWLMEVVRHTIGKFQFDFVLCALGGHYEEEARNLGCKIYQSPPIRNLSKNLEFLTQILSDGHYDGFHVHGEEFMGDALKVACDVGVPIRIAHCHNTVLARGKRGVEMMIRRLRFRTIDRPRILKYATNILACSTSAAEFLLGEKWERCNRATVIYCGIDSNRLPAPRHRIRKYKSKSYFGIPDESIVIGHVGSMGPGNQKNHKFLIDVFYALAKKDSRYHLVLVGDGPNRGQLSRLVKTLKLESRVSFLGTVNNVPALMRDIFDAFALPSLYEGLPIAGLEAVGSGLMIVCSTAITKDYINGFATRISALPLSAGTDIWANALAIAANAKIDAVAAATLIRASPFDLRYSITRLAQIYTPNRTTVKSVFH